MNLTPWFRRLVVAVPTIALAAAQLVPGSAGATPSSGVGATTLVQSTFNGMDYVTKEITIAPGGTTGWHYHPGRVFALLREGTLTHYTGDCTVDGVFEAGAPITERSGPGYVHEGRNEGTVPVVMWVLYIDPAGSPLAVDVPSPDCPFA